MRPETTSDPSASAHEFREGLARHQQGNLVAAERHYDAALKSQPDNFDALHMVGVIALQKGRIEEGIDILAKAVALNQSSPIAFNNLAKGLKDLGRFDEAIIYFQRAITLAPAFADAEFNCGTALHFAKRSEDALVHFDKAIALHPNFVPALNNRGLAPAKLCGLVDPHMLQECPEPTLIFNKAITRQYHTWFDWKGNTATTFFSLFGADFKKYMEDIIKKDEELRLAVAAFMELGRDRNRLIHEDFATVALEKTAEEIYQQYKSALCFVARVGTALRSCSARDGRESGN
jgi:tetratricopeptide (TPR) repeat protein